MKRKVRRPFSRRHSFLLFLSHFKPLPFRGMSLWSQGIYPSLPRYTPCILVSRVGSALPHRVNSHQTNSVDYVVYSRSHAFHGGTQTLRRKHIASGIESSVSAPKGDSRTLTPPERSGHMRVELSQGIFPRKITCQEGDQ